MRKKFLLTILSLCCSNQVWADQVKKLKDKEFVIKKNRNESLQDIQKPKNLIINSDEQKFVPYNLRLEDLDLEIKALPVTLDLRSKEKRQKVRHNLIRLGVGSRVLGVSILFDHLADIFLKKKIGDFSSHLIIRSRTPNFYLGWQQNSQFFTDYAVSDFCKPYFVFNQSWNSFSLPKIKEEVDFFKVGTPATLVSREMGVSGLDLDFKIGCPIFLEKSEFLPSASFRYSKFDSKGKDVEKSKEKEVNLNFDFSFDAIDNIKLACDTRVKNLFYDGKCKIYDFSDSTFKELGSDCNVTFLKVTPKVGFVFNKIEITPKLFVDYCSNKRFVKSDTTNFALGIDVGYEIDNLANFKFFYKSGLNPNTLKKQFKKIPFVDHQAFVASDNKLKIGLQANTQWSNFKFNIGLQVDSFNTLIYNFKYNDDVNRYKGNIGALYESDCLDVLMSAGFRHFQIPKDDKSSDRTSRKIKSDIFFSISDKVLWHLRIVKPYKIMKVGFDAGINYVYSDLFTFFVNCGFLTGSRLICGMHITPDKWIKKDYNDQLI